MDNFSKESEVKVSRKNRRKSREEKINRKAGKRMEEPSDVIEEAVEVRENPAKNYKFSEVANVVIVTTVMFVFFIGMFFTTNGGHSDLEKRDLATFPKASKYTIADLIDGTYFSKIDDFFSDNFVKRDTFIAFSDKLKSYKGVESEIKMTVSPSQNPSAENASDKKTKDTQNKAAADKSDPKDDEDMYSTAERVGTMLSMGDTVCEAYGYNKPTVDEYTQVIKKFGEQITTAKVYNLLVPTHVEFALPAKYQNLSAKQEPIMKSVYDNIGDKVTAVNVYDTLKHHKREYIYFKSDHHWTQLGSYYAYVKYCEDLGMEPFNWDDYKTEKIEGFLGTLYAATKDQKLADDPDVVEYKPVGDDLEADIYTTSDLQKCCKLTPYAKTSKGNNAYGVFLYADYPLTVIKNPKITNGKKVAVVKESYGNPFSILLSQNYSEVHAIDIREFREKLADYVEENDIDDVIFINNMIAVGSQPRIDELKKLLK